MNAFLKENHTIFIVGFIDREPSLEAICKEKNIPYISLQNSYRYPENGNHWTPKGHDFICKAVYNFLLKKNFIKISDNATA
jgi:hypothetical protein